MSGKSRIFALDFNKGKHMSDQQKIDSIRNAVRQLAPPHSRAILYGSRARGDARRDSDWDILILVNKPKAEMSDFDNLSFPLTELGWECNASIIPVVYGQSEWDHPSSLLFRKNVERDAVELV